MGLNRSVVRFWFPAFALFILNIFVLGLESTEAAKEVKDEAANIDLSEKSVKSAIEDEIITDPVVPFNDIKITLEKGIVTLDGEVDSILMKDRAANLVQTVKGVKSVINRIEVNPVKSVSKSRLKRDVVQAFLLDPATESYEITVETEKNGVVELRGSVDGWQERRLAETVAKTVSGVREVKNNLDVDYKMERPDSEIKSEIEKTLKWDLLVDHALITPVVNDARVTLTGVVGSSAEKSRAQILSFVAGVKSVDADQLDVEKWARDANLRKNKFVTKSDDQIEEALNAVFTRDPRLSDKSINIDVSNGTVILRGQVDSVKGHRVATMDARNTVGVVRVKNRLKVTPQKLQDRAIERNILTAIQSNPIVEKEEIQVKVENGEAILKGKVDSLYEKAVADDIVAKTSGVKDIDNNLEVSDENIITYDPYVEDWYIYDYEWFDVPESVTLKSDKQIEDEIGEEMFWSPYISADKVNVTVDEGTAKLEGVVDSWAEMNAAIEQAFEGGAIAVVNSMEVQVSAE